MSRLTVTPTLADIGHTIPLAELEAPPTPDDVAALHARGVRGIRLRSGSWARGQRAFAWLAELQPLVLQISARGTVPTLPPEALADVRRLDLHPRTRLRTPVDVAHLPRAWDVVAAASQLVGELGAISRLRRLQLDLVTEPSLRVLSGLHELEYVRLDMARGDRAPFDFRCDDPPRRLRELWVMDAALGTLDGLERLQALDRLLISPGTAGRGPGPVDLAPLGNLALLRDVRIVAPGPFSGVEAVNRLPAIEIARIGDWNGDRPTE